MPVEPAAASVWQEAQVLENTFIPAARLTAVAVAPPPEAAAVVEVELELAVEPELEPVVLNV